MGSLQGSRFHLKVSLRYDPLPGETAFLCDMFGRVSKILWDATDGVLSLGQIDIASNSTGGANADIWVYPGGEVWPNALKGRMWQGGPLETSRNYLHRVTLLTHELGHYLFDLGDEYGGGAECCGKASGQASLMELYEWGFHSRWVKADGNPFVLFTDFFAAYTAGTAVFRGGQPSEFCHDGNHDPASVHAQNVKHGNQSCWRYMADDANHHNIPYGLTAPGAAGPKKKAPSPPPAVTCFEVAAQQKTIIHLLEAEPGVDASRDPIRTGAAFWVDAARAGERFGIAALDSPTLGATITTVPDDVDGQSAWRSTWRDVVGRRRFRDRRADGDDAALRATIAEIAGGDRTSSQGLVLLGETLSDASAATLAAALPDLRAANVRIDVVTTGSGEHAALLANAAAVTGGTLVAVDAGSDAAAALDVTEALIRLAGATRENGGALAATRRRSDHATVAFDVVVSPGAALATLGAVWDGASDAFRVTVLDPTGKPAGAGGGAREVALTDRYGFVEVEQPMPGRWTIQVARTGGEGLRVALPAVRPIASEVHESVALDLWLTDAHVRIGDPIVVHARLRAPQSVAGATIVATVRSPDGGSERVAFTEHTGAGAERDDAFTYSATIETKAAGAYLIEVDAARAAGSFDVPLDELYAEAPDLAGQPRVRTIRVPELRRRGTIAAVADAAGRAPDEPTVGHTTLPPRAGMPVAPILRPTRRTPRRAPARTSRGG